ncbi:response regulator transcription factor [Microscilla marina]|uniref:Transcriptional regulator, LuxR family protein n=1 Tax=Microscilla marina ATCC 23134 TaxID=313606 RepID=A1ZG56_MICM2|nr:helix-turn-helix transcriptional regulator [Microscilla marina]EAY30473.1 transcriptional regulator, LuxR family protein [Microscilla marina ATCC 23134]
MAKVFTEKEILEALERQAFLIQQRMNKDGVSIEALNDSLPGRIVINLLDLKTMLPSYIGHKSLDMLNIPHNIFFEKPMSVIQECLFPGDFEKSVVLLKKHLSTKSKDLPISYIQRTKLYKKDSDYSGMFTVAKQNVLTGKLCNLVLPVEEFGVATNKMTRLLEETLYVRHHYRKFATLTNREKEIITLLVLGYQNNEIGEQLFISKATVEQHRKNLKRKLEVRRFVDLIRFAQAFDLI